MKQIFHTTKLLTYSILLLIFLPASGFSQQGNTFVNPGIKLGYRFGAQGGFIIGAEVSIDRWYYPFFAGFAVSADYCFNRNSNNAFTARVEIEGGPLFLGISAGPAFELTGGAFDAGFTASAWSGLILLPYYNLLYTPNLQLRQEAGLFLKYPVQTPGLPF